MSLEELQAQRQAERGVERRQLREARAEHMLLRRLAGQKLKEIARDFAVPVEVVRQELLWARYQNMQYKVRDYMATAIAPKALAALEVALDNGSYEAARDFFQGYGIWNKNVAVMATHLVADQPQTFEQWRERRAQGVVIDVPQSQPQSQPLQALEQAQEQQGQQPLEQPLEQALEQQIAPQRRLPQPSTRTQTTPDRR